MEGIVSTEYLFQLTQAIATHNALHVSATEKDTYPNGGETSRTAGLKIKATISRVTILVYCVPVEI